MELIEGRQTCRGDGDMIVVVRPDKRTYSGVAEKIRGFDEGVSGGRIQTDADML